MSTDRTRCRRVVLALVCLASRCARVRLRAEATSRSLEPKVAPPAIETAGVLRVGVDSRLPAVRRRGRRARRPASTSTWPPRSPSASASRSSSST